MGPPKESVKMEVKPEGNENPKNDKEKSNSTPVASGADQNTDGNNLKISKICSRSSNINSGQVIVIQAGKGAEGNRTRTKVRILRNSGCGKGTVSKVLTIVPNTHEIQASPINPTVENKSTNSLLKTVSETKNTRKRKLPLSAENSTQPATSSKAPSNETLDMHNYSYNPPCEPVGNSGGPKVVLVGRTPVQNTSKRGNSAPNKTPSKGPAVMKSIATSRRKLPLILSPASSVRANSVVKTSAEAVPEVILSAQGSLKTSHILANKSKLIVAKQIVPANLPADNKNLIDKTKGPKYVPIGMKESPQATNNPLQACGQIIINPSFFQNIRTKKPLTPVMISPGNNLSPVKNALHNTHPPPLVLLDIQEGMKQVQELSGCSILPPNLVRASRNSADPVKTPVQSTSMATNSIIPVKAFQKLSEPIKVPFQSSCMATNSNTLLKNPVKIAPKPINAPVQSINMPGTSNPSVPNPASSRVKSTFTTVNSNPPGSTPQVFQVKPGKKIDPAKSRVRIEVDPVLLPTTDAKGHSSSSAVINIKKENEGKGTPRVTMPTLPDENYKDASTSEVVAKKPVFKKKVCVIPLNDVVNHSLSKEWIQALISEQFGVKVPYGSKLFKIFSKKITLFKRRYNKKFYSERKRNERHLKKVMRTPDQALPSQETSTAKTGNESGSVPSQMKDTPKVAGKFKFPHVYFGKIHPRKLQSIPKKYAVKFSDNSKNIFNIPTSISNIHDKQQLEILCQTMIEALHRLDNSMVDDAEVNLVISIKRMPENKDDGKSNFDPIIARGDKQTKRTDILAQALELSSPDLSSSCFNPDVTHFMDTTLEVDDNLHSLENKTCEGDDSVNEVSETDVCSSLLQDNPVKENNNSLVGSHSLSCENKENNEGQSVEIQATVSTTHDHNYSPMAASCIFKNPRYLVEVIENVGKPARPRPKWLTQKHEKQKQKHENQKLKLKKVIEKVTNKLKSKNEIILEKNKKIKYLSNLICEIKGVKRVNYPKNKPNKNQTLNPNSSSLVEDTDACDMSDDSDLREYRIQPRMDDTHIELNSSDKQPNLGDTTSKVIVYNVDKRLMKPEQPSTCSFQTQSMKNELSNEILCEEVEEMADILEEVEEVGYSDDEDNFDRRFSDFYEHFESDTK